MLDRIPGEQGRGTEIDRHTAAAELRARIHEQLRRFPGFQINVLVVPDAGHLDDRDIGEPGLRVVRHRMPAVHAHRTRPYERFAALVTRAGHLDRATRFQVDMRRPRHLAEFFRRQQFAVLAVDDVEEAVLRCVQQGFHGVLAKLEVREHDVHVRVVVPGFARYGLVVPLVFPRIGVERDDGTQEQVVAAVGRTDLLIPRRTVAGADQDLVELRVVGEAVPRVAAAAVLPPFAGPRLRRHFHRRAFETVGGIARHDPETPRLLAGVRVVGRDVTACGVVLRAAVADEHLAVEDFRCAGDVVTATRVDRHRLPHFFTGVTIQPDEAAIDRGDDQLVLPHGRTLVLIPHDAQAIAGVRDRLRIVFPQDLAADRVNRACDGIAAGKVDHPVDDERRGEQRAIVR